MEFSIVEGSRSRPKPGLRGTCPACGQPSISKCGPQVIWHWAHHGRRHCDPWWENETEWHRRWKSHFPEGNREIVHFDQATGEKHVADIKTAQGIVIELQHSGMPLGELQSRESFYKRMIWIIDGKPFAKNFKIYPEQLPHPDSKILNDVVFEGPRATAFWRRSEQNPNSELVEIHSARKIADDIAEDYRGHHFFSWTRPRNIWYAALSPVFIDFGGEELFLIKKYKPETQRVIEIVSKKALLEENGGSFSKD